MRHSGHLRLVLASTLAFAFTSLTAQQPIQVKVNLVNLTFTARDQANALVSDLKAEDVDLFEDGVQQRIAHFSQASDVPLTLGILIDASSSQDHFTKQHQHDIEVFLKEVLRPQDKVFLVCFGNHLRLMSDFTSSPKAILQGLEDFKKNRERYPEIGPQEIREGGTAFYDSIYYSIAEKMVGSAGRRALLAFSDGEDNSSAHDMMSTLEASQSANTQVYTIRYTDIKHDMPTARNKYGISVMDRFAADTGAQAIDAAATDPRRYFQQIAGDLRYSYELAYYPTNTTRDGTFRKIFLKPHREGVSIHARSGYISR